MEYRGLTPHDPSAEDLKTVTFWLIAANIAVFFTDKMILHGALYRAGGLYFPNTIQNREYYRILTAAFLHSGFSHLAYNMLSLFAIGFSLEKILGHLWFCFVYFASAIFGHLYVLYMEVKDGEHVFTVGASGAIFGLMGALLVLMFLQSRNKGEYYRRQQIRNIMMALVFMFLPSSSGKNISVTGHMGGFLSGAAAGLVVYALTRRKTR